MNCLSGVGEGERTPGLQDSCLSSSVLLTETLGGAGWRVRSVLLVLRSVTFETLTHLSGNVKWTLDSQV